MHNRSIQLWAANRQRFPSLHAFRKASGQTLVSIERYARYQYFMFQTVRAQVVVDEQNTHSGQQPV